MSVGTPDRAEGSEVAAALARAALYRLLGAAFSYPGPERCGEVARLAAALAEVPGRPESIAPALATLVAAARAADPAGVADEHMLLFDRQVPCSPHEGAYGEGPQVAGKAALLADLSGFYTAFGVAPSAAEPEVEDHVVAELEFMSVLAVKEAWALGEGQAEGLAVTRAAEVAFLADHLSRWATAFAEAVEAATPLPYYTAAARLLAAWTASECDRLGVVPVRVAGPLDHDPMQSETFTCPMAASDLERPAG